MKIRAFALLFFLTLTLASRAWDIDGHMIVEQIALDRLTPNARSQVDKLSSELSLAGRPLNAVNIAAWADEIKHERKGPYAGEFKNWHFIDLGCNSSDPDLLANPPKMTIQNGDIVSALNRCVDVLKNHRTDPLITNDVVALALLIHLVGDIHQPLHCTTHFFKHPTFEPGHKKPIDSDVGGNALAVSNFDDEYAELHQFWDVAYKVEYSSFTKRIKADRDFTAASASPNSDNVRNWANEFEHHFRPPNAAGPNPNFAQWAGETHALGFQAYKKLGSYPDNLTVKLSKKYVANARNIASQQLCVAGYRLGDLLNEIYK